MKISIKKKITNILQRNTAEHHLISYLSWLLSDLPSSHFNSATEGGKKQSLRILAYWVGNLSRQIEMFPSLCQKNQD
jgi:hypothetical protein